MYKCLNVLEGTKIRFEVLFFLNCFALIRRCGSYSFGMVAATASRQRYTRKRQLKQKKKRETRKVKKSCGSQSIIYRDRSSCQRDQLLHLLLHGAYSLLLPFLFRDGGVEWTLQVAEGKSNAKKSGYAKINKKNKQLSTSASKKTKKERRKKQGKKKKEGVGVITRQQVEVHSYFNKTGSNLKSKSCSDTKYQRLQPTQSSAINQEKETYTCTWDKKKEKLP